MRLHSIKLAGFKSFVDPTNLVFQSNLTAIVGPNGCGKSNIVDAIHCVLGSTAKNLRADQMADIIFNGTTNRKPVSQAALELIFDNSEGRITGEYAKFQEISIRRELNRDGQSSYYINSTRCRRRDITDIFLGTGLGPNSYAIIEQGMISKLIEAKPDELRVYVEEAAGISKYKERRRETENRIRHTRENLDRLNDIREELAKQLQHLQRQANAAERYKVLKNEQRLFKAQLQTIYWRLLTVEIADVEIVIRDYENQLEAKITEQRHIDTELEEYRLKRIESNDHVNEIQSSFYGLGSDISRLEQTIHHAKERQRQLETDQTQLEANYQELQQQLEEDQLQIEENAQEIVQIEESLAVAQQQSQEARQKLSSAENQMMTWQENWDEFNSAAAQVTKQIEVEKTRIQHLEQRKIQLEQRITRIQEEQSQYDLQQLKQEINALSMQRDEYEQQVETIQEKIHTNNDLINEQRKSSKEIQDELNNLNNHLRSIKARLTSLEALQEVALGKNQHSLNTWLENHQLSKRPRLAEGLEVEKGWEIAVETVLGSHLEAVCVENIGHFTEALNNLNNTSITLFNTGSNEKNVQHKNAPSLIEKIKCDWSLKNLLAHIYIAETLSDAFILLENLDIHESVITRDGVWLGHNWLQIKKAVDEKSGIIQREKEIKLLTIEINAQQELINEQEQLLQTVQENLQQSEVERQHYQQQLNEMTKRYGETNVLLSSKETRLEQLQHQAIVLEQERVENEQQLQEVAEQLQQSQQTLTQVHESAMQDSTRRMQFLEQRDEYRTQLETLRQQALMSKQQADDFQVRFESMRNQQHYLQQNILRNEKQLHGIQEKRENLKEALIEVVKPIPDWNEELHCLLEKRSHVEHDLNTAKQILEQIETTILQAEKNKNKLQEMIQDIRNDLENKRLSCQALKIKHTGHQEQVEQAGFTIEQIQQELPEEVQKQEWEEKIERVDNRIQRLGAINLAAIEEYAQLSERKQFLDQQNDDLVEALNTLENAIRKIDRETRSRFKETFTRLNDSFKEYFKEIFCGGDANLELTDEDLLESGVLVKAQPPGKRNSTIHLLSGGEKALTAIALVFGLFNLNPAPFCVLDEVDAPLDDVNVGRFCNLVKKMSEKVQFIFISHNKITIEMGQQLAGVTMQEAGVSRLVSVDIDQAIALANV